MLLLNFAADKSCYVASERITILTGQQDSSKDIFEVEKALLILNIPLAVAHLTLGQQLLHIPQQQDVSQKSFASIWHTSSVSSGKTPPSTR